MLRKRVAAGAAAAAMVLTGLGSAVATPAFAGVSAGSAKCELPVKIAENVKVYATNNGKAPGAAVSAAPPRNQTERERNEATVIGLLLRGEKACVDRPRGSVEGQSYPISEKGGCHALDGKSNLWHFARSDKVTGWIPAACAEFL